MNLNPYEILGVDRNANEKAIKKAYRKLVSKWHPDLYHTEAEIKIAEEMMKKINSAFELIGSPKSRSAWDAENPVSVYEYYSKKQTSQEGNTKYTKASKDIEMEKQRRAVLQFLNVEFEHKSNIFDMFAELVTGAVNNEFSDDEYAENLCLIIEDVKDCIEKFEQIIAVAKKKMLTGLDNDFVKVSEAIRELEVKSDQTPKTLKAAHYAEETRLLTEKISDLMSKLPDRIIAVTRFNLLEKTWEFETEDQLDSERERHKSEVSKLLADIDWIFKTSNERSLPIDDVCVFASDKYESLDECRKMVEEKSKNIPNFGLKKLRKEFWEKKCEFSTDKEGKTIFAGVDPWHRNIKGTFIIPPNVDLMKHFAIDDLTSICSLSIPARVIYNTSESICLNWRNSIKSLIITFDNRSQLVDISKIKAHKILVTHGYILISNQYEEVPTFALVDSNNIYIYDEEKYCSLYGVKSVKKLPHYYPYNEIDYYHVHTWAMIAGKLVDPSIMKFLPCTTKSIKNWLSLDTANFNRMLLTSNYKKPLGSNDRLIKLYVALGALKGPECHAQAESLILSLDTSIMYRSRLERVPNENKLDKSPMFSVPKSAVDFVENNIDNEEFLPYVYIFLEGYNFFQSEAKKAKVSLTPNFVILTAPQYVFHSKADRISDFAKELLKSEKDILRKQADYILYLRTAGNNCKKNIIVTTDVSSASTMHYKYFDLKSLQSYLALMGYFKIANSFYKVESENVFLSSNSHAIEIINNKNERIAIVILNLLDEGELFADIVECDYDINFYEAKNVIEVIGRALIDQKNSNNLVTGISIGSNENPNTSRENYWRNVTKYGSDIEWVQNAKWIKFEYLFESRILGTSYKGYRARFMVEGHEQKLKPPHPYHTPENRRNRNRW